MKNLAYILDLQEETFLINNWKNNADQKSLETLFKCYQKFICKIATLYSGHHIPLADLVSEGNIGFMKALSNFDVSLGSRFSSFALIWVKYHIQSYVIEMCSLVRLGKTKKQRHLFFNLNKTRQKLSDIHRKEVLSQNTIEALAAELKVSEKDIIFMDQMMSGDFSLDAPLSSGEGSGSHLEKLTNLSDQDLTIESQILNKDDIDKKTMLLNDALQTLQPRYSDIFYHRRLIDQPLELSELAEKYQISKERVRQIENAALEKVKAYMLENIKDT